MAKSNKFGTFGGVFTPSILTILGVIMYLRLPMIVGEAGLWATIGIIIVAHIISVTTGLSVSSIATDKKVEAGGTYYMISRSLGLPIGGTLGLALFVGLSFSVSLYLIGFSESFLSYWGWDTGITNVRLTGTLVLIAVTTLTFISTSLAIKTQYFILAAIILSLMSIFFGSHDYVPEAPLLSDTGSTLPLMVLFGIFFPAVTGFEAGVSMSGDLKDAKKSIPSGSIMAIVVGLVVYVFLSFFLSYTVDKELLANDPGVLLKIAWIPELVVAGIWGATLSSALGSILGAPRILQATAVDKISPKFFAKGYGPSSEPRNALLLTFVIAEAGILIGELDVIARIVSIFFITTYGFLNISAAFESWTSADFRPEFKVPGWMSLVGALACILVMIQLDFVAMIGAVLILGLLFLYLKRKELTLESGDAWHGVWASLVRRGLSSLSGGKLHHRNWRPNIILFGANASSRKHLMDIGKAISGQLGILSGFELIETQEKGPMEPWSLLDQKDQTTGYFSHRFYCHDVYSGMDEVSRVFGFPGIQPNTILMGWSREPRNREHFVRTLNGFKKNNFNSIFLDHKKDKGFGNKRTIDIWWQGEDANLALAINLVRNITASGIWKESQTRLLIINPFDDQEEYVYRASREIIENYRVEVEVKVLNNQFKKRTGNEWIAEESGSTDLVIYGIPDQKYLDFDKYYGQVNDMLDQLGSVLLVNSSSNFEKKGVFPARQGRTSQQSEEVVMEFPPLKPSPHKEVALAVTKTDTNNTKALEVFYKKGFQDLLVDHLQLLHTLQERVVLVKNGLQEIDKVKEQYRKKKALDKLKNDTIYKINTLFSHELKEVRVPLETKYLGEGIQWYIDKIENDFKQYPKKLKVSYQKEEFAIHQQDTFSLRGFKRWKKFKHFFVGRPITHHVLLQQVARHYQLRNRYVFLDHLLSKFRVEAFEFYDEIRRITNTLIDYLEKFENQGSSLQDEVWGALELLEKDVAGRIRQKQAYKSIFLGRLKLEARKNLQQMSNDLDRLDINKYIQSRGRKASYYREKREKVLQFAEEYNTELLTLVNKLLMELSVESGKNRMEALNEEFNRELEQTVQLKLLKELDKISDQVGRLDNGKALKTSIDTDFERTIAEGFDAHTSRMLDLVSKMPEELEVYSRSVMDKKHLDTEVVSIPVSKMAEYFVKTHYISPVEEKMEQTVETLKRSVYTSKDIIHLTKFNLENTQPGGDPRDKGDILKECVQKLDQEKEKITAAVKSYSQESGDRFGQTFNPLNPYNIEESARNFGYGLRTYQGKRVIVGVNTLTERLKELFQQAITRLFYSRSEGILIAKTLNTDKKLVSVTGRMLDIRDKVSPLPQVLDNLPHYYTSLYNGKSNIGEDFWIERKQEEGMFKSAIHRYRSGYYGGVLVLGERNEGKTTFCKHQEKHVVKAQHSYSVFPPLQGAASAGAFDLALARGVQRTGDSREILGSLPQGTMLIINDLELFWERSGQGLEAIRHVLTLIDEFSYKILFVVNMNPHAYKLINQLMDFGTRFIEIISFQPFDAERLKDLVIKRHNSSGLAVGYREAGELLNDVRMANLFNRYFDYSEGNPGVALNGWLANVTHVSKDTLVIKKPESPSLSVLKEISDEWAMILVQFILHKRLDLEKMLRIDGLDRPYLQTLIQAMARAGIIQEKASGIWMIDPYVHPFITRALKDEGLL